jgi:uncharacterized OB-fold protein
MTEVAELKPVAAGLIAGTPAEPRLIGSRCRGCGTVAFPRQASCQTCMSEDVEEHLLARTGPLWTWTIQCFPPKSPPYAGSADDFQPYGVGYVELGGEVRVEGILTESDPDQLVIGMAMELTLIPAPGRSDAMTFAFKPEAEQ